MIKIDFSDGMLQSREDLDRRIYDILNDNARYLEIALNKDRDIPELSVSSSESKENTFSGCCACR